MVTTPTTIKTRNLATDLIVDMLSYHPFNQRFFIGNFIIGTHRCGTIRMKTENNLIKIRLNIAIVSFAE